jgi:hypothetical protein
MKTKAISIATWTTFTLFVAMNTGASPAAACGPDGVDVVPAMSLGKPGPVDVQLARADQQRALEKLKQGAERRTDVQVVEDVEATTGDVPERELECEDDFNVMTKDVLAEERAFAVRQAKRLQILHDVDDADEDVDPRSVPVPWPTTPAPASCIQTCQQFEACVVAGAAAEVLNHLNDTPGVVTPLGFDPNICAQPCPASTDPLWGIPAYESPCETPTQVATRLAAVDDRWATHWPLVMGHRGSVEFAAENTLESLEATMTLGGDGNEFDVFWTIDGMPFALHDDHIDSLLHETGITANHFWSEVRDAQPRSPGVFGKFVRTPTLFQVLALHRRHAAVFWNDMKSGYPVLSDHQTVGMINRIIQALKMETQQINYYGSSPTDASFIGPDFWSHYSMSVSLNGMYAHLPEIQAVISNPNWRFLETKDVRPVLSELGRPIGQPSCYAYFPSRKYMYSGDEAALVNTMQTCQALASPNYGVTELDGETIRQCAEAADLLGEIPLTTLGENALINQAWNRSNHLSWRYHDEDGALALGSLMRQQTPSAAPHATGLLYRGMDPATMTDPALQAIVAWVSQNQSFTVMPNLLDWRTVFHIWIELPHLNPNDAETLAWDFLNLSSTDQALLSYDSAVHMALTALTRAQPGPQTMIDLLNDGRIPYRSRAIIELIDAADAGDAWALPILQAYAPEAVPWISAHRCRSVRARIGKYTPRLVGQEHN